MPLPKPRKGEEEDDFIGRCMSDETMKKEYPDNDQRVAVCYSQWRSGKENTEPVEGKALTHNSKLAETEPSWGSVDKKKLPRKAFADMGDRDKVSTWTYPHHFVVSGGKPDEDGRYTSGTMYLHKGGLAAAWGAAHGARSGEKASAKVISHLSAHRKALGLDGKERTVIDSLARRVSNAKADLKLAAKGKVRKDDPGWIEGYAAVWDNVDHQGEVMRKGAFAKSVQEAVPAGKVKLMVKHYVHGGSVLECIGTVREAKEDDYGLWFRAELSKVQLAQDVRTKVLEGHVDGCSVGYRSLQYGWLTLDDREVLEHKECAWLETTITVMPANELAVITGAKSMSEEIRTIKEKLADPELDLEALDAEAKSRLIEELFETREKAEAFLNELTDVDARLRPLLLKPEDTAPEGKSDGDDKPKDTVDHRLEREKEVENLRLNLNKLLLD